MSKKIAIIQSNYIPWKGYFDIIRGVDEFIFFDDVQYTRRDWRNRNKIKTQHGLTWLTVPVISKNNFTQKIKDTVIDGANWQKKHWRSLELCYGNSDYFSEISDLLKPVYLSEKFESLSNLNHRFIKLICGYLGINPIFSNSSDFSLTDDKNNRLINLCLETNSDIYVTGPSARNYIKEEAFKEKQIQVKWVNYGEYPEYSQSWGKFEHNVSVLDLLFNCGENSNSFMNCVI